MVGVQLTAWWMWWRQADVDCGGSHCTACRVGQKCGDGGDCTSLVCKDEVCAKATCTDGELYVVLACLPGDCLAVWLVVQLSSCLAVWLAV